MAVYYISSLLEFFLMIPTEKIYYAKTLSGKHTEHHYPLFREATAIASVENNI